MPKYTLEQQIITFWNKVNKNAPAPCNSPELGNCWEWTAGCFWDGYGNKRWGDSVQRAHRISWQLANGKIPNGLLVLHKCDNRKCVNPAHLFLGTNQDNMDDMKAKGRSKKEKGRKMPPKSAETIRRMSDAQGKITRDIACEIRNRYKENNISQKALGIEYGLSQSQICNIVKGSRWKD